MLKGAIICPDEELAERLAEALHETGLLSVVRSIPRYPPAAELSRMLRAQAPQVLFVGAESVSKALEIAALAEEHLPGIQIVAIGRTSEPQTLLELMRGGVREFLTSPFRHRPVEEALLHIQEILERRPVIVTSTDMVVSFLPAKPGVGATTIVSTAAVFLSQMPDQRALLLDCDLSSGMTRFLFQLENNYSMLDAAQRSYQLDDNIWPQLVSSIGNLDIIHAGRLNPDVQLDPAQLRHLLDFARRTYRTVLLDLSGHLEKFALEAIHESKWIFLVVTPELPALHQAREKLHYLRTLELGDRVKVLLNRCQRRTVVSPAQIEELLGQPLLMTFANDYQGVHRAITAGKTVAPDSELGSQLQQLANFIADKNPQPVEAKKSVGGYFSLLQSPVALFSRKTAG